MSPEDEKQPDADPGATGRARGAARRTRRVDARLSAEEVLHRWGYVYEPPRRPEVLPVDPAAPGQCLCGDSADFVVETAWFSGRRSRDPVCGDHVDEVVHAIRKQEARRDGG
jgi:hypothetical protein